MDPLAALREVAIAGNPPLASLISEEEKVLNLPSKDRDGKKDAKPVPVALSAETLYKCSRRKKMLTIEAVYRMVHYFQENPKAGYPVYSKACKENKWPEVSIIDLRDLRGYMSDASKSSRRIQKKGAGEDATGAASAAAAGKRTRRDGEENTSQKRQKTGTAPSGEGTGSSSSSSSSHGEAGTGAASDGARKRGGVQSREGTEFFLDPAKQAERRAALLKDAAKDGAESVQRIVQEEVRQRNRFSVLVAKDKDFMVAVKSIMSFQEQQRQLAESRKKKKKKKGAETGSSGAMNSRYGGSEHAGEPAPRGGWLYPIIVLPQALTSVLNMYNVEPLLVRGQYVDAQAVRQSGWKKPKEFYIQRPVTTENGDKKVMTYKIVDNPKTFTDPNDFKRIVAVVAHGKEWQFKGWNKGSWQVPSTLFSKVRGFYINMKNTAIPDVVRNWNVRNISIDKNLRHLDAISRNEFWSELDRFVRHNKPAYSASKWISPRSQTFSKANEDHL